MSKITLQIPEKSEPTVVDYTVQGNAFLVTLEGAVYEGSLVVTGVGEGWIHYAGKIMPFYMTQKNDQLSIWVDACTYTLKLVAPGSGRRQTGSAAVASGDIKSPMPGTVLKVPVKTGDAVEANQALVIMESMKMEMTLSAPKAGKVKAIHCREGQMVEMGVLLIELE